MKFIQNQIRQLTEKIQNSERGFSLIETLVGISIFIMISMSIYQVYVKVLDVVSSARLKVVATALANEQFEILRNLPYSDVGVEGGIPNGKIKASRSVTRSNTDFTIKTTVRNIDDPFDGFLGGAKNDLSPADYKLVEIEIGCTACKNFQPVLISGRIAPKNLETASTNGALFINVIDASGQPVGGADIHIENNAEVPAIVMDDVSNNSGVLQIVDAPPGVEAYEISTSKIGYSADRTYTTGDVANPNPTKPNATVVEQNVTSISFAIDKTSSVNVSTVTESCAPVANVSFNLSGSKLIGVSPNVLKYDQDLSTNSSGVIALGDMEWDAYNVMFNDSTYDLGGSIPLLPMNVAPDSNENLKLVVASKSSRSFLVTVMDSATGLPLTDAFVTLEKGSASTTLVTNQGFFHQTDWSGGSGQADFLDDTKYLSSDGNIETGSPDGELRLKNNFGTYVQNGELISSSFEMGSDINLDNILWNPSSQPAEVGADSIKFQIATNDDDTTWDFVGPDDTSVTFYTAGNSNVSASHNGHQYLRYKVFLHTDDTNFTPNLSDVSFTFTSGCIPPGQVLFKDLASGMYVLTVTKDGYTDFIDSEVDISSSWDQLDVLMTN